MLGIKSKAFLLEAIINLQVLECRSQQMNRKVLITSSVFQIGKDKFDVLHMELCIRILDVLYIEMQKYISTPFPTTPPSIGPPNHVYPESLYLFLSPLHSLVNRHLPQPHRDSRALAENHPRPGQIPQIHLPNE
jgi:hypothetical protein